MTLVGRYELACPNEHTTFLPEGTLRRIADNLLDRADPQITFICSQCKTAFRFDYLNSDRRTSAEFRTVGLYRDDKMR